MPTDDQPTDPLRVLTELYEASIHVALFGTPNFGKQNAEWIAESHNLFPALKEQIKQLQAEVASMVQSRVRSVTEKEKGLLNAGYSSGYDQAVERAEKAEAEVKRLREAIWKARHGGVLPSWIDDMFEAALGEPK